MYNFEIRPFEIDDLPVLQQIRKAAFGPVFQSFREIVGEEIYAVAFADADREQAELLDSMCAARSGHQLFVGLRADHPVGFVSFSFNRAKRLGEIGLNAVHPDHAGQGIGTSLYEFAMARMKDNGIAVVTVGTGGDASHLPARKAYRKAGFGPAIPSISLYKLL